MNKVFSIITILLCMAGNIWGQIIPGAGFTVQATNAVCKDGKGVITVTLSGVPAGTSVTVSVKEGNVTKREKEILDKSTDTIQVVPSSSGYFVTTSVTSNSAYIGQIEEFTGESAQILANSPRVAYNCDNSEREITVQAQGDARPFTFIMEGPEPGTGDDITFTALDNNYVSHTFDPVSTPGIYYVHVEDPNGCKSTKPVTLEPYNKLETIPIVPLPISCRDDDDASVTISVTGGKAPIRYFLDDRPGPYTASSLVDNKYTVSVGGGSDQFGMGLTPGQKYTVEIYDGVNCSVSTEFTIENPSNVELLSEEDAVTDALCYGSKGSITVSATGGTGSKYNFRKSNDGLTWEQWVPDPATGSSYTFSNLPAGEYSFTAQDENECLSDPIKRTVKQPDKFEVSTSSTPLSCDKMDEPDGTITVTAVGGTQDYTVTAKKTHDANNTEILPNATLDPPNEDANGNFIFTGLSAGKYEITASDANNCPVYIEGIPNSNPIEVIVEAAQPITITGITPDPAAPGFEVECAGEVTFTATVNREGNRDFEYKLSDNSDWNTVAGSDEFEFSREGSGNHNFNIEVRYKTEENVCSAEEFPVNITIPEPIMFTLESEPVSCYTNQGTDDDGTITVTVEPTNPLKQYSYEIFYYDVENDVAMLVPVMNYTITDNVFSGLKAGTYKIAVTDETDGCNVVHETEDGNIIEIERPGELIVTEDTDDDGNHHNILCPNVEDPDGSFKVKAEGNTRPHLYKLLSYENEDYTDLNTVQTHGTFSGLDAGNYAIRIIDIKNCVATSEVIIITRPQPITFTAMADVTELPCATAKTDINITVISSDAGPFVYRLTTDSEEEVVGWTEFDGTTNPAITGVVPGEYIVEMAYAGDDKVECRARPDKQPVVITEQENVGIKITGTPNDCAGVDRIQITVEGNGNLPAGVTYSLWYKTTPDENAGYIDFTENAIFNATAEGYTVTGKNPPYYGLPGGLYLVVGSSADGSCSFYSNDSEWLDISDPAPVEIDIEETEIFSPCSPASNDGKINVRAKGGEGPYQYALLSRAPTGNYVQVAPEQPVPTIPTYSSSGNFTDLFQNSDNKYYVRIIDKNGCSTTELPILKEGTTLTFQPLDPLDIEIETTHVSCYGGSTGIAKVTTTGGRGEEEYRYLWKKGTEWNNAEDFTSEDEYVEETDQATISGLPAGDYVVTVYDGCNAVGTVWETVHIDQPESQLEVNRVRHDGVIDCYGNANGYITVETSGGWPFTLREQRYDYEIIKNNAEVINPASVDIDINFTEGNEILTISGLIDGDYMIKITDARGCTASLLESVNITNPIEELNITKVNMPHEVSCDRDNIKFAIVASGGNQFNNSEITGYILRVYDLGDNNNIVLLSTVPAGQSDVEISTGVFNGEKEVNYNIEIEDSIGCTVLFSLSLTIPKKFAVIPVYGKDYICPTDSKNGIAVGTMTEGQTGQTTQTTFYEKTGVDGLGNDVFDQVPSGFDTNNVPAGTYRIEGIDGKCKTVSETFTFWEYKELEAVYEEHDALCTEPGSIEITPVGGKGDGSDVYTYQIFNKNNPTQLVAAFEDNIITGLESGDYFIMMSHKTIEAGCIPPIRIPASETNFIHIGMSENPIGNIDLWYKLSEPVTCEGGIITVAQPQSVTEGTFTYTLTGSNGLVDEATPSLGIYTGLKTDNYTLHINQTENGCFTDAVITVVVPEIKIENVNMISPTCNETTGKIEFDVLWSGASNLSTYCTNSEDENSPLIGTLTETVNGEQRWHYQATVITEGYATIKVVENGNGCFATKDDVYVTLPKAITLIADPAVAVDCGVTEVEVKFTITGGTGDYKLIDDENGLDIIVGEHTEYTAMLGAGDYTVQATDGNCFSDEVMFTIKLPESIVESELRRYFIITPETCNGSADGSISISSKNLPGYSFKWSPDNPGYDPFNADLDRQSSLASGEYRVTVTNSDGCSLDVNTIVEVDYTINVNIEGNGDGELKNEYCPDSSVELKGAVEIAYKGVPVPDFYTLENFRMLWEDVSNNKIEDFIPENSFMPSPDYKTVQLRASFQANHKQCRTVESFEIVAKDRPVLDFPEAIYIPDIVDEYELDIVNVPSYTDYKWSVEGSQETLNLPVFPDPPFPVTLYPPANDYKLFLSLTGDGDYGCPTSGIIEVKPAIALEIPNVFTPNGDGINDTWMFRHIDDYTHLFDIQVIVFNRGGVPVFQRNDYSNDVAWNGQRNQNDLPIGTYWYVVKIAPKSVTKGLVRELRGTVVITR